MIGCHDEVGHMGGKHTLSLLRERFFWPCMTDEVEKYLAQCHRCLRRKAIQQRASLVNITTTQPLEMVCIDFLSLEPSKGGIENVLLTILLTTPRLLQLKIKLPRPPLVFFSKTISSIMDFLRRFIAIREETLRVRPLDICVS